MKNLIFVFILLGILILGVMGGCNGISIPLIDTPTPTPTPTPTQTPIIGWGTVYGSITDSVTGAFLDGVHVKVNGQLSYVSLGGAYTVKPLGIGSYTFTFEKSGYETVTVVIDIPQANSSIQYNLTMSSASD